MIHLQDLRTVIREISEMKNRNVIYKEIQDIDMQTTCAL